ncbi:hypothetical protein ACFQY0_09820 [Haloferula chungangensis]|uniref:Uncharacterized protein n=1 Tax=Haloferula chungangensis TaxID=1048331 RepID=A0ABW2L7M1_9BACT
MNASNDQHDRIREELSIVNQSLTHVRQHLDDDQELTAIESGLSEAVQRRDSKRDEAHKAGERLKQWFTETKDQVIDKLEDLKTDIEIHRIEKDADRKEEHACDAVIVAAHALMEAEVAVIEAIKARKMAIEVAG